MRKECLLTILMNCMILLVRKGSYDLCFLAVKNASERGQKHILVKIAQVNEIALFIQYFVHLSARSRTGRVVNFHFRFSDVKSFPVPCGDKSFSADFGRRQGSMAFFIPGMFCLQLQLQRHTWSCRERKLKMIYYGCHYCGSAIYQKFKILFGPLGQPNITKTALSQPANICSK